MGKTKVYIIDKAARVLPSEDADVSDIISRNFESKGVTVHHGATLESLKVVDGEVEYVVKCGREGKLETIRVEKALLSIGRVPNLSGIGLEATGCQLKDGSLVTSDCQTTVPHIWAAGDSTVDVALVSIAEFEARHVVERIWGTCTQPISYENISTIMFLDPTVASSGMNEQTLQKQRIPYKVARYAYPLVSRAVAKRTTGGFVKLMVSMDRNPKFLGIRALGTHASSIVDIGSMARPSLFCLFPRADVRLQMIRSKRPVAEILDLMVAYPAMTEGLQECARLLFGQSIYKPQVFPEYAFVQQVTYDASGSPIVSPLEY